MKRLLSVLFSLLLATFAVAGQPAPADPLLPLRRALAGARTDTARGRWYWGLSELSERSDSTIYFAQRAIALLETALPAAPGPERQRLLRLLGGAVNNLGVGYSNGQKDGRSIPLYRRAARLRQQGRDVRGQVESLRNLANNYESQNDYAQAVRYCQEGIRAGEGVPAARSQVAYCLSRLGLIYGFLGDKTAELRYQLRALALLRQSGERQTLLDVMNAVSAVYLNNFNDTARAEAYARQVHLLAAQPPEASQALLTSLMLRGRVRLLQHRVPAARTLLLAARQLAAHNQIINRLAQIELFLALTEEAAHNWPLALRYARQAVVSAGPGNLVQTTDAELTQSRLYDKLGQPQAALDHYRRYVGLRDSVRNEQNQKVAFRQRLSYEYAGKAAAFKATQDKRQAVAAAEIRRQQQLRTATSAGALLLLALAGGLYFAFRRAERLKQLVTNQKQDLQGQRDQLDASLTELRTTQTRLIQKEKMASLGELSAGIAHEIQNPLNFVNNFAEVSAELMTELEEAQTAGDAAEATALAADVRQNLTKIAEHGRRAAGIVRGMMEHARPSTGERAPTDLNALAAEYLRLAHQGLRAQDPSFTAALETDFAPGLPLVPAVGADLGRVLLNLFANAFYAVRQRQQQGGEPDYWPTVGVATRQVGGQVEIRVSDNGTGMNEATQAKIFQPFFTTKPAGEGTGLGLSLSYDIVAQGHGGTLAVASTTGQGTVLVITLPV